MLKLKKLSIKKHPLLDVPIDLSFSDGENILVGINGSGKTTLLELIRSCLSGDFSQFKDYTSEVELAYRLADDDNDIINIEYKLEKDKNEFEDGADFISDSGYSEEDDFYNFLKEKEKYKHYFKMNIYTASRKLSFILKNERLELRDEEGIVLNGIKTDLSNLSFFKIIHRILLKHFFQLPETEERNKRYIITFFIRFIKKSYCFRRFTEGLDYYDFLRHYQSDITVSFVNSSQYTPLSYPNFLKPENFIENVKNNTNSNNLTITSKDFPLLDEINNELNFLSIKLEFYYPRRSKNKSEFTSSWESFLFIIDIDEDTTITDDKLSYGEKRFISLMLYLEGCGDVIILDEPINGLHHNLIDTVVDKIYADEKQSFIANQNSTLFDYIDFNSAEEVKEKLIFCNKKDKKMSWRNPTDDEAQELFTEVEKDFMYLGEILRMKELW